LEFATIERVLFGQDRCEAKYGIPPSRTQHAALRARQRCSMATPVITYQFY
jgi:hypothetical protein